MTLNSANKVLSGPSLVENMLRKRGKWLARCHFRMFSRIVVLLRLLQNHALLGM